MKNKNICKSIRIIFKSFKFKLEQKSEKKKNERVLMLLQYKMRNKESAPRIIVVKKVF